jgi:hypothetical protein
MGRPKKWENNAERMRAYRAANPGLDKRIDKRIRKRPGHGRVDRPFIAIDGEALGEQGYHLLAASTGDQVENRTKGLSSADCLRFLLALKEKHGAAIYCGFALGYDSEHWIRDYGPALWEQLREKGEGIVNLDGWKYVIQYIPKKWFKIGFYNKAGRFLPKIEVFDLFTFFQTSFVAAVGHTKNGWGAATPQEMEVLQEWKGKRGGFTLADWDSIVEYNQIECRVLVRLANKLREALEMADIRLRSWHGPGAVANFLLKQYNMGEHITEPEPEIQDAIARAYFGGRFQVFRLGHFEGVYDYDISSAYPYATTLLPSTRGEWQKVEEYQGDANPWCVYRVSWDIEANAGELTPFPYRDENGGIHFPTYGRGWYWGWEVAAALRGWGDAIRIETGWRLYPVEERVFHWMNDLAAKRVAAKLAADTAVGPEREKLAAVARAYKLALNSVYGKTIQTVGQHRPFLCPMWAGLITSRCRATLLTAALADPSHLICFATDGLFTSAPNAGVNVGSQLGEWELAAKDIRLELYQSGCYAIYQGEKMTDCRFRGISRSEIPWDELRKVWERKGCAGSLKIKTRRFIGHRTALHHNKPELQCQWVDMVKDIELQPGLGVPFPDAKGEILWLGMNPVRDYSTPSERYKKLPIGETELELFEAEVQP